LPEQKQRCFLEGNPVFYGPGILLPPSSHFAIYIKPQIPCNDTALISISTGQPNEVKWQ